ncbi:F-box/FBD/LRR-repeat protein At2g26030-like [Trifolium pratense]|uniref:F-box/FBD/LRR-repeat protein At2g26030-like n=1 Tax=Trifolium pratense TaxID=57577 RepID=UPI001E693D3B|nr:F-box/FBD/LRR-repeat protein At2g26030-like [Trifolium pratense]
MSQLRRLSIDRISALPDSLLHRILSFLTIKEAAATSILSKTWNHLWLRQLIVNFNDEPLPNNSVIADYRDNNLSILQFHLKSRNFSIANTFHLFDILNCKTLVVLNLNNIVFDEDIPYVDLPSLILIRLESVTFTYYSYMIKILSCPILQ